MKAKFLIPLLLFVVMVVFLAVGLGLNPREVPSPLINKPAPTFKLTQLDDADKSFSPTDMLGKVWLLNVWASWCVPCREEHPILIDFARKGLAPVVGMSYKDQRKDAVAMLRRSGNPYSVTAFDGDGRVGIDYGVYGVPESYVIDKAGIIRYKHVGPISAQSMAETVVPLITKLNQS